MIVKPGDQKLPYRSETQPSDSSVQVLIKSQERKSGSLNDATFFLTPPLPGLQSITFEWFSLFNLFPNIKDQQTVLTGVPDNKLAFIPTAPAPVTSVTFPEGRYLCGFGTVTNTQVRNADASTPGTNLNDIRWFLIRACEGAAAADDVILAVNLNPATGLLSIQWNPVYVSIENDPGTGSLWSQLGFAEGVAGLTWTATRVLNLGDPLSIALCSNAGELTNESLISTGPSSSRNNWFAVIPIQSAPNTFSYFEPYTPLRISTRLSSRPLISFNIQIRDPVTGHLVPMSASQNWQLMLRCQVSSRV